jgi:hypothetical protein
MTGHDSQILNKKMLSKRRVDFIISYYGDDEAYPEWKTLFRSYSFATSKEYVSGRIMCNDTEGSRKFIGKVNKVLRELYLTEEFSNAILDFTPDSAHELIKHIIHSELIPESVSK